MLYYILSLIDTEKSFYKFLLTFQLIRIKELLIIRDNLPVYRVKAKEIEHLRDETYWINFCPIFSQFPSELTLNVLF